MSEIIVVLNVLIILGMVVSAVMAVQFDKLLSSIIALGVTGIFAAAPCPGCGYLGGRCGRSPQPPDIYRHAEKDTGRGR